MNVVAGVTGNTGSVVAESLLAEGKPVRVVVRSAEKGAPWKAKGAEVAVARLEVAGELAAALRGATGAYLLLPPDYASKDTVGDKRRTVDAMARAIPESGVGHVVFLSSIGAQHAAGTGPIVTVRDAELRLGALDVPTTFVRAAYFLENLGALAHPARTDGVLPAFFRPDLAIPMVATADIGRVAARALVEGPAARGVIELAGPREVSLTEAAAAFARALGRPVRVAPVPPEAQVAALVGAGLTEDLARLYAEMNRAVDAGLLAWEGGAAQAARGATTVDDVLARLLAR